MRLFFILLVLIIFDAQLLTAQNPWNFDEIGAGTKPAIHVDNNNDVHITALKESQVDGYLSYFGFFESGIMIQNVLDGYFYGPIDIITSSVGTPVIAYHDHLAGNGNSVGELALATRLGADNWTITVASHPGHDGWDGTIAIDANNSIHAVSTDPSNGTEYGQFAIGQWTIETIDPEQTMYQYGTDIEVDPDGTVHVTYFTDSRSILKYASKIGSSWLIEEIDTNAVFPSMIMTHEGPVIAYYKVGRNGLSNWDSQGQIMIAKKINGVWTREVIETIQNVATGIFSGARAIVDLQLGSDSTQHIAFGNSKIVKYGTYNGTTWSVSVVLDVNNETYNLGEQVSLDIEDDGTAHIATFRRTGMDEGMVIYGNNRLTAVNETFICPPDTIISCDVIITPDNTGQPDTTGGFSRFEFFDATIQACPSDIIIQRSWIGFIDDVATDSCNQLITVTIDDFENFSIQDTLRIDEVCIDELDELIQTDLDLPCDFGIDNIDLNIVEQDCHQIVLSAEWRFINECRDTTIERSQTIIIENRVVAKLNETIIIPDTGNASGSITLIQGCSFDQLSYEWSTGSSDSLITELSSGTYVVTVSNAEGCMDTLVYEVTGIGSDTMMMDTMMMDTMMMDTMMMDTMMMDTMMMDTMMMDTMMMDTMMMDTMMMDTMMMDTMMMDTMMMDTMMMDTMMMDTMMMDTMMMDTMMMDTMMMDTMMMDTMMMDTMMMDTMMMDTMMMDTMMMDTMMMDTMMMDTMMMDTMMMDTMMMDTMMMDTMMMDTMMMDTMMMDTMMMDTMMMDTMMMDTMMMDTMMMDTMMMDTMMMDTMMMDTMMMDTMMMDTMMMDTMMMDTMMMDTMMMDTMMMDTMMMDTMMMDTMMMDTMMMDTVIKTSLLLNILDRSGSALVVDSIYFIKPDSSFVTLEKDSSGAYIVDTDLTEIAGVCLEKSGKPIDSLSVQDLTRGQRIILQFTEGCPEDRFALDVSGENVTSAFDLALMRSILLDRISEYPGGFVWRFAKNDDGLESDATDGSCILLSNKDRVRGSVKVMGIKLGDLQCSE